MLGRRQDRAEGLESGEWVGGSHFQRGLRKGLIDEVTLSRGRKEGREQDLGGAPSKGSRKRKSRIKEV